MRPSAGPPAIARHVPSPAGSNALGVSGSGSTYQPQPAAVADSTTWVPRVTASRWSGRPSEISKVTASSAGSSPTIDRQEAMAAVAKGSSSAAVSRSSVGLVGAAAAVCAIAAGSTRSMRAVPRTIDNPSGCSSTTLK
jgi:hypothetical protein